MNLSSCCTHVQSTLLGIGNSLERLRVDLEGLRDGAFHKGENKDRSKGTIVAKALHCSRRPAHPVPKNPIDFFDVLWNIAESQ